MKDEFYRLFITGDRHGRFDDLEYFCQENGTTEGDALVILGDAGILYYGENRAREKNLKAWLLEARHPKTRSVSRLSLPIGPKARP